MTGMRRDWSVSARVTVSSRPSPNEPPDSVTEMTRTPDATSSVPVSYGGVHVDGVARASRPSTARSRASAIDTSAAGSACAWSLRAPACSSSPSPTGATSTRPSSCAGRAERGGRHVRRQVDRNEADRVGRHGLARLERTVGHRVGLIGRARRPLPRHERAHAGQRHEHPPTTARPPGTPGTRVTTRRGGPSRAGRGDPIGRPRSSPSLLATSPQQLQPPEPGLPPARSAAA